MPDPMGFVRRVLGELAERLAAAPPGEDSKVVQGYGPAAHQALIDRSVLLAAALCGRPAADVMDRDPPDHRHTAPPPG
ncbi:hypothetical protein [Nonomuraea jabiensis]|uniref:Uncharacterized protein n=1 Tax=Nonomuraea jabiensis TaxID=882448 RepID=A0A7W9GFJ4_9ACTN|nr:hypothetical protein [Nonomuraea jabiensis]MBB5782761.1 hypothetical protein [Nonomuraea jabiensis]